MVIACCDACYGLQYRNDSVSCISNKCYDFMKLF